MKCEHFAKTGITLSPNHDIGEECRICPLREEKTGDCIKDIYDDGFALSEEYIEPRVSAIWERYYKERLE